MPPLPGQGCRSGQEIVFLQAGLPLKKVQNKWFLSRMVVLGALFLTLNLLASRFYFILPGSLYTTVHMILEFVSIVVAVSVSLMSWYDYRYNGQARVLVLSATFCVVGLITLAHALSYFGMPDFITANSVNKASTFYILARIIQAVGLLAAVLCGGRAAFLKKGSLVIPVAAAAAVVLIYLIILHPNWLPAMYDPQLKGQTAFKIYLEFAVMAVMLAAALLVLKNKEKDSRHFYLGAALLAGIMSDLDFTFYSNAYDVFNLLGHIYNVISYTFILKALMEEALNGIYQANLELERKGLALEEANRQLKLADKLKNDFLANTNHELRSPLSAIVAFTELLSDQENTGPLNDLQKDYLKEINDSGRVLLTKINGLLYLTGVLGGKVVLHLEGVSLGEIIRDVAEAYQSSFRQKGIGLQAEYDGNPVLVGDREKISRVLVNLLENALKFTGPGGKVEVRAGPGPGPGETFFSVQDNGIGIAPAHRELIFSFFYQVDGASTRRYGGTGIGLTLAAKLVEMHGGRIVLDSESGRGSKFTVILPVKGPREVEACPQE